ncbi:GNAT family N-acetyltransferase [Salinibacterium sp. G-O1]|uniref:GNAT family N-acetyltransferase n=1 Tax=Salinibacterium sp. G-O1 TaxID=3046208 RepID=UPI0024BBDA9D|nr:GNAT family N-acetyltransferase [Salinibacterium sp. G-O1]MDJ0335833.1 GNAT family N-acetyltransferase [Salinibacterium sp. G-O1]
MIFNLSRPASESVGSDTPMSGRVRRRLSVLGLRTPRLLRGPRVDSPLDSPTIRTERLVIRPHSLSDADAWYQIQSDPGVIRFLSWPLRDPAESLQHLKDRTSHTRLAQADDLLALAIEHDGQLVGDLSVHLRTVHPDFRSAEIGWILSSAHGGSGLASEAVHAVIDMLFTQLDVKWMFALVDTRNDKSLALASRLGFTEVVRDGAILTMMLTKDTVADAKRHNNS